MMWYIHFFSDVGLLSENHQSTSSRIVRKSYLTITWAVFLDVDKC